MKLQVARAFRSFTTTSASSPDSLQAKQLPDQILRVGNAVPLYAESECDQWLLYYYPWWGGQSGHPLSNWYATCSSFCKRPTGKISSGNHPVISPFQLYTKLPYARFFSLCTSFSVSLLTISSSSSVKILLRHRFGVSSGIVQEFVNLGSNTSYFHMQPYVAGP